LLIKFFSNFVNDENVNESYVIRYEVLGNEKYVIRYDYSDNNNSLVKSNYVEYYQGTNTSIYLCVAIDIVVAVVSLDV
jgi:hypothetical protein